MNAPFSSTLSIRPERPDDIAQIAALTEAAFAGRPYSRGTERFIVGLLRNAGALRVSLVAERDGRLVGHIAFSPVQISDGSSGWYGLGPVSVWPDCQRQGIGQALVRAGLAELRALGAHGCVLLGDPAYYGRFGFAADARLRLPGVPPAFFQALRLDAATPAQGDVSFHPAFDAKG
jgi:putative acetyltransferase